MILLSTFDLVLVSLLVLALGGLCFRLQLGVAGQILIAALRCGIQLAIIGLVLTAIFATVDPLWIAAIALVMLAVAGREVHARQHRRLVGMWGYGISLLSMLVSAFALSILALAVIVQADPWYTPQYAIPLLGMLLGNIMNGVALGVDRLTDSVWQQRRVIENRLMLGQNWNEAISGLRRQAIRSGLIPVINMMAAAGLVSMPGMMTGQILAGSDPLEAVKYQVMILFLVAVGSGVGTITAVYGGSRRLFDKRERLRLDRLSGG
jgi:putative ABC transport system permease protein